MFIYSGSSSSGDQPWWKVRKNFRDDKLPRKAEHFQGKAGQTCQATHCSSCSSAFQSAIQSCQQTSAVPPWTWALNRAPFEQTFSLGQQIWLHKQASCQRQIPVQDALESFFAKIKCKHWSFFACLYKGMSIWVEKEEKECRYRDYHTAWTAGFNPDF